MAIGILDKWLKGLDKQMRRKNRKNTSIIHNNSGRSQKSSDKLQKIEIIFYNTLPH